mmetsp:Transcript_74366/g.179664  ORF Transcript_74366/g.179664 Transcript_74366/m.179664 type:complete len:206 (+) Transcript_74366:794-1411(+)
MILRTESGNMTSRKRILYPQMMRCLLVCLCSQLGHWYCTRPYSKPAAAASEGSSAMKAGERKFLSSQNLTLRSVRCSTETIMILRKRSYRWPDASEKTCTVSSSAPPAPPKPAQLLSEPSTPASAASSPPPPPPPSFCRLSSSRMETRSMPGRLVASSSVCSPEKECTATRSLVSGTRRASSMPDLRAEVALWPVASRLGSPLIW